MKPCVKLSAGRGHDDHGGHARLAEGLPEVMAALHDPLSRGSTPWVEAYCTLGRRALSDAQARAKLHAGTPEQFRQGCVSAVRRALLRSLSYFFREDYVNGNHANPNSRDASAHPRNPA
jgi:hypothetical protein